MSSVVVLTAYNAYHGERSLRDVLRLYVKGKIEIVKSDESRLIRAGINREGIMFKMPAPLVVRLTNFFGWHIKKTEVKYSDQAVYDRDNNICQYWHFDEMNRKYKYKCTAKERTIDHVIPKAQGGTNSFKNCVTCCREHNEKVKRNRTPKEAGLQLIRMPQEPVLNKGDMAVISFCFDPNKKAHQALYEWLGVSFSHEAVKGVM